jgi:hypothetical protein
MEAPFLLLSPRAFFGVSFLMCALLSVRMADGDSGPPDITTISMAESIRCPQDDGPSRGIPALCRSWEEALTIAKFEPGMYEIVRTFWPTGEKSQFRPYPRIAARRRLKLIVAARPK